MEKLNPNLPEGKQDMELKPIVFGPPRYGSPDPETNRTSLNAAVEAQSEEREPAPKKTTTKKSSAKKSDDE